MDLGRSGEYECAVGGQHRCGDDRSIEYVPPDFALTAIHIRRSLVCKCIHHHSSGVHCDYDRIAAHGHRRRWLTGEPDACTYVARLAADAQQCVLNGDQQLIAHHDRRLRRRGREPGTPELGAIVDRERLHIACGRDVDAAVRMCRLRYGGSAHTRGFAIYRASHDDYQDSQLPSGLRGGSSEEALDTACGLYLGDPTAWT